MVKIFSKSLKKDTDEEIIRREGKRLYDNFLNESVRYTTTYQRKEADNIYDPFNFIVDEEHSQQSEEEKEIDKEIDFFSNTVSRHNPSSNLVLNNKNNIFNNNIQNKHQIHKPVLGDITSSYNTRNNYDNGIYRNTKKRPNPTSSKPRSDQNSNIRFQPNNINRKHYSQSNIQPSPNNLVNKKDENNIQYQNEKRLIPKLKETNINSIILSERVHKILDVYNQLNILNVLNEDERNLQLGVILSRELAEFEKNITCRIPLINNEVMENIKPTIVQKKDQFSKVPMKNNIPSRSITDLFIEPNLIKPVPPNNFNNICANLNYLEEEMTPQLKIKRSNESGKLVNFMFDNKLTRAGYSKARLGEINKNLPKDVGLVTKFTTMVSLIYLFDDWVKFNGDHYHENVLVNKARVKSRNYFLNFLVSGQYYPSHKRRLNYKLIYKSFPKINIENTVILRYSLLSSKQVERNNLPGGSYYILVEGYGIFKSTIYETARCGLCRVFYCVYSSSSDGLNCREEIRIPLIDGTLNPLSMGYVAVRLAMPGLKKEVAHKVCGLTCTVEKTKISHCFGLSYEIPDYENPTPEYFP
jgi:hypothetical protein